MSLYSLGIPFKILALADGAFPPTIRQITEGFLKILRVDVPQRSDRVHLNVLHKTEATFKKSKIWICGGRMDYRFYGKSPETYWTDLVCYAAAEFHLLPGQHRDVVMASSFS